MNGTLVSTRSQCPIGNTFVCGEDDVGCVPGQEAVTWWGPPLRNFDNIGRAMLTLFVVTTMDNWMSITRSVIDVRGEGKVPEVSEAGRQER